jgi:tRNA G18 (ribose-2'-O)-methylase SpoU
VRPGRLDAQEEVVATADPLAGPPVRAVRIVEPGDPRVADFAGLRDHWREGRADYFVAEGPLIVGRLLRSRYRVRTVLVAERMWPALDPDEYAAWGGTVFVATQPVVDAICGFNFHRGVLASAHRAPLHDPLTVAAGTDLLLLAEGVNDHENLGSLFRNAAAFGAGGVVFDARTCDPLYRRSIRVSMGHVLHVPFARADPWLAFLRDLQRAGFDVAALTPGEESIDIRSAPRRARQAVLVGAEGAGLHALTLAAADRRVRIPMAPGVDSVNVATAAAIALHQWAERAPT